VGALLAIMAIVKWTTFVPNSDGSFNSPFIMVFQFAGLNWASALIFFVVLTSASSALNSVLYSTGRHLYQLATESKGTFMSNFAHTSKNGVPAPAVLFSAGLVVLSPVINAIPAISSGFTFLTSASSAVYIGVYVLTMIAHWQYRKSQDFMPDGFLMPAYKILNPVATIFFIYVYITLFLAPDTFWSAVGGLVWIVVFGWYSHYHTKKYDY
jgi:AAT family amino acid transporter